MSNATKNQMTFAELAADPQQTVRFTSMTVGGEPVIEVNDGQYCWLLDPKEMEIVMEQVDENASVTDWYSWFCSATCHNHPMVPAFEAEHGVRNWP